MANIPFQKISQDYYPLGGGLDLVTPAISLESGKVIDSQNYEPAIGGGYRRIDGYERIDGQASPTSASYYIVYVALSAAVNLGDIIIGNTSAATGVVLANFTTYLVCGRVTGTFNSAETINVLAVNKGVTNGVAAINGATIASNHADYALLAANDQRTLILKVPGSGAIRGVFVYLDILYALRDNVGATAGAMYKATVSGWVLVPFGTELQFSSTVGGTTPITVGQTIANLGAAPTKTATVIAVLTRSGTWGTNAIGTLIIAPVTGTWANAESIFVGATQQAVSTTAATAITRLVGGTLEPFQYNFTGSTNTKKMYGVDGVNLTFEFDGTNYIPIRTGMTLDAPSHVIAHKGYLFLGFLASVQYSSLGNPYSWTVVLGSGEIDCSRPVTGFLPQGGTAAGSALAIFTAERTFVLYGTSNTDFKLVSSIFDIGYSGFTCQQVSNDAYGMTNRGIQTLITTLNYGDFDYDSVSHMIQPLVTKKRGLECASNTIRTKNQYRVYFTDGTALVVGLTGDKANGLMAINYNRPVRCIFSTTLSTGAEVTYFGSDDGYVYQDNIGTSQDGVAIESWLRLPFNNDRSPRIRKRYRRAIFELVVDSFSKVNISYDMGYGDPNVQPSAPQSDTSLIGAGGYWDQFTWDQFTWDAQFVANPVLSIDGTEKNISFIFYSNRAQDQSHTFQGVTLIFSPRILQR